MRLLIAGWQGQIAQALIDVAPSRADIASCAIGRPALDICNVRSIDRALAEVTPDIVINTAAYTDVEKAEDEPERAFAANRDGAGMLAAAAARRGLPIIQISTDYVFDGQATVPYRESDALSPATVYGRSKAEGEAAVMAANPQHIIVRTAWVYGPHGRNFIKTILKRAREGVPLRVVADQRGSPTYAPDLVAVLLDIAARMTKPDAGGRDALWGVYHAAGSGGASWHDMARHALASSREAQITGAHLDAINAADYPTRAPRPAFTELDCSKLESTFGLRLPQWQDGVARCVARLSSAQ